MDLYVIVVFINAVVKTFAIEKLMRVFFEKRKTSFAVMILSYSLFGVLTLIRHLLYLRGLDPNLFGSTYATFLLFYLSSTFLITFNYQASMLKRVFATLSAYAVWEVSIALLASRIVDSLIPGAFDHIIGGLALTVVASIIYYFLAVLAFKYFKHIRKNIFDFRAFVALSLVLILYGVVVALYNHAILSGGTALNWFTYLSSGGTFLVFFIYNALSKEHENKLKTALHTQEKEYYFTQCVLMQESVEKMKSYRHDVKLHLATLRGLTADNKAATNYVDSLLGDMGKNEVYSETGNIVFDSIINFKLRNAIEESIALDIKMLIPPVLNVEAVDIVTILGNLLENALEAVTKIEEKKIRLYVEYVNGGLLIQVDNTFDGVVEYTKDKSIASLKDDAEHGYGLKNIQKSVDKYNGHVDITYTEDTFSVGILLYVDDLQLPHRSYDSKLHDTVSKEV